ncbi:MAG: phosphatase PAP2 family protein [Gemmataceae bacterium]|nr:phosphatase PAP2 family protein [Gemmataceae bacterium]
MRSTRLVLICLLSSLAPIAVFAAIAIGVVTKSELTGFDEDVANRLHEHALASPAAVLVFRGFTFMANAATLLVLAIAVALVLVFLGRRWQERRSYFLFLVLAWIVALAGGATLNASLKGAFERQRPQFEQPLVHEKSLSFPSGHSMNGLIAYGMLAYLLVLATPRPRQRTVLIVAVAMLVLHIGFSRIYLGAHWFSDVIGGFMAGAAWLIFCIVLTESLRRRRFAAVTVMPNAVPRS